MRIRGRTELTKSDDREDLVFQDELDPAIQEVALDLCDKRSNVRLRIDAMSLDDHTRSDMLPARHEREERAANEKTRTADRGEAKEQEGDEESLEHGADRHCRENLRRNQRSVEPGRFLPAPAGDAFFYLGRSLW